MPKLSENTVSTIAETSTENPLYPFYDSVVAAVIKAKGSTIPTIEAEPGDSVQGMTGHITKAVKRTELPKGKMVETFYVHNVNGTFVANTDKARVQNDSGQWIENPAIGVTARLSDIPEQK